MPDQQRQLTQAQKDAFLELARIAFDRLQKASDLVERDLADSRELSQLKTTKDLFADHDQKVFEVSEEDLSSSQLTDGGIEGSESTSSQEFAKYKVILSKLLDVVQSYVAKLSPEQQEYMRKIDLENFSDAQALLTAYGFAFLDMDLIKEYDCNKSTLTFVKDIVTELPQNVAPYGLLLALSSCRANAIVKFIQRPDTAKNFLNSQELKGFDAFKTLALAQLKEANNFLTLYPEATQLELLGSIIQENEQLVILDLLEAYDKQFSVPPEDYITLKMTNFLNEQMGFNAHDEFFKQKALEELIEHANERAHERENNYIQITWESISAIQKAAENYLIDRRALVHISGPLDLQDFDKLSLELQQDTSIYTAYLIRDFVDEFKKADHDLTTADYATALHTLHNIIEQKERSRGFFQDNRLGNMLRSALPSPSRRNLISPSQIVRIPKIQFSEKVSVKMQEFFSARSQAVEANKPKGIWQKIKDGVKRFFGVGVLPTVAQKVFLTQGIEASDSPVEVETGESTINENNQEVDPYYTDFMRRIKCSDPKDLVYAYCRMDSKHRRLLLGSRDFFNWFKKLLINRGKIVSVGQLENPKNIIFNSIIHCLDGVLKDQELKSKFLNAVKELRVDIKKELNNPEKTKKDIGIIIFKIFRGFLNEDMKNNLIQHFNIRAEIDELIQAECLIDYEIAEIVSQSTDVIDANSVQEKLINSYRSNGRNQNLYNTAQNDVKKSLKSLESVNLAFKQEAVVKTEQEAQSIEKTAPTGKGKAAAILAQELTEPGPLSSSLASEHQDGLIQDSKIRDALNLHYLEVRKLLSNEKTPQELNNLVNNTVVRIKAIKNVDETERNNAISQVVVAGFKTLYVMQVSKLTEKSDLVVGKSAIIIILKDYKRKYSDIISEEDLNSAYKKLDKKIEAIEDQVRGPSGVSINPAPDSPVFTSRDLGGSTTPPRRSSSPEVKVDETAGETLVQTAGSSK